MEGSRWGEARFTGKYIVTDDGVLPVLLVQAMGLPKAVAPPLFADSGATLPQIPPMGA